MRGGPRGAALITACNLSGFHDAGLTVIRTGGQWRAACPNLRGCADTALPRVDFARQMVLVVAHGEAGSTGYDVGVDSVVRRGGATLVYAVRRGPPLDAAVGAMLTQPVVAVAAPAAAGPVRLVARDTTW